MIFPLLGMVATAARTMLESLDRIPNDDDRTRISLIAVDSNLHFFFMPVRVSTLKVCLACSQLTYHFLAWCNRAIYACCW